MSRFPYFKFFHSDYLDATRNLSLEQRGAYVDYICLFMMMEGKVPDDARWMAHQMHISARKWEALKGQLEAAGKIRSEDGVLVNERCVMELAALLGERKNRSEAANSREKTKKDSSSGPSRAAAASTSARGKKTSKISETVTTVVPPAAVDPGMVLRGILSSVQVRFGDDPSLAIHKNINEINGTNTTVVAKTAVGQKSEIYPHLNNVQARLNAESTLTHGSVDVGPGLENVENTNKINGTNTTVVPLRALVETETKTKTTAASLQGIQDGIDAAHGVTAAIAASANCYQSQDFYKELSRRLVEAANGCLVNPASAPKLLMLSEPLRWIANGCDLELDILPAIAAIGQRGTRNAVASWEYFAPAVADAHATRLRPMPATDGKRDGKQKSVAPQVMNGGEDQYGGLSKQRALDIVKEFFQSGTWSAKIIDRLGPEPGSKGCKIPQELISQALGA